MGVAVYDEHGNESVTAEPLSLSLSLTQELIQLEPVFCKYLCYLLVNEIQPTAVDLL